MSFDDLVSLLPKFRENFPNVEHFEFTETNVRNMSQINALALVQGEPSFLFLFNLTFHCYYVHNNNKIILTHSLNIIVIFFIEHKYYFRATRKVLINSKIFVGITSLMINREGNPIYSKPWRQYAIYRLEHWGLLYINNKGKITIFLNE